MTKTIYPATLLCDFYKVSHKKQYPHNTEVIYSTFTPRSNRYFPKADRVVVFGIQGFIKKYLIDYFNTHFFNRSKDDVVSEYARYITFTMGEENPDTSHIEELHDLGHLPIELKALKEGMQAPIKVPVLTMENTDSRFFWLTNYLETLMSAEIWQAMTSATTAYQYRKLLDKYAIETTGTNEGVGFQGHDFSARGMAGLDAAAVSAAAHLLSFTGTDTIPGISYLESYYNANIENELVGASIPATEHSVMCAGTDPDNRDEYDMYKRLITEIYPTGFFSVVSDTYDFWKVVSEVLPSLKAEILNRDGRTVIRPDSGNPVEIICGMQIKDYTNVKYATNLEYCIEDMRDVLVDIVREETPHGEHGDCDVESVFKYKDKYYKVVVDIDWNRYDKQYYYIDASRVTSCEEFIPSVDQLGLIESLWNTFGGTVTEQGYKVLDTHIGAIYGDSITLERAEQIVKRLKEKGFASTNIVLGIGSYTYQHVTRDTLGFAMKATYARVDGEEKMLFKDPKTDDGTKRSLRGKVAVIKNEESLVAIDGLNFETHRNMEPDDQLETVFKDGELIRDQSLKEMRKLLLK